MKQNYNPEWILTENYPLTEELQNLTGEQVEKIISERSDTRWSPIVWPILSFESFWYLPKGRNPIFDNFLLNYFSQRSHFYREQSLDSQKREYRKICDGEKDFQEMCDSAEAFIQFRENFPKLDLYLFNNLKEYWSDYSCLSQELKVAIYSAYAWMRTQPGVNDTSLFS